MFDNHRNPQAAPAARTADIDIEKEVWRVKRKLQTADDRQAVRLAKSRTIVAFLDKDPLLRDDAMEIGELGVAKKDVLLNPVTVATIGQSGRGKSTENAALIGRSDVHAFASGKSVTACVTRTFKDLDPDGSEGQYAVLQMRSAGELRALAERQVKTLGVDDFRVPTDIEDLPDAIHSLGIEATPTLEALLEVIQQFIRHEDLITGPVENRRIPLESPPDIQRLHDIVREDSAENLSHSKRIVDIVKSVDIHLYRPTREDDTLLQLSETCLVDTPGTGGARVHSWGLQELISDADGNIDIILFCLNPRRVTETEFELARYLNAAIRSGNLHPQQLLLIHNAIDEEIQHAESETAISELMHVLGGDPEMFEIHETSALSALWALEASKGKPIPNPAKYKSMAVALGLDPKDVRDINDSELHTAVYEKSGLPELIQAINKVTRAYTVKVRVKAAETSVNNTVSRLSAHYDTEHEWVAEQLSKHGPLDVKAVKVLAEMEADAKAYIAEKRAVLLKIEPEAKLQTLFTEASETLNTRLGEVLPKLWDDNRVQDRLRTVPTPIIHRQKPRSFVSDIEEWIWQHLDLVPVGRYFADRILTEFGENTYTELLHFAFDTPAAKDVMRVETVREMTSTVGNDIIDFAKNIGKAMLGKPKYRLLPSDLSNPSPVVKILETITNTHDVDAAHFEALRDAISESYETGIREAVTAIRGYHDAKLADIERAFDALVFQTFLRLQDARETLGATLFDAADDEIHALHLQKQTLDEKRTRLKTIETLMTLSDTDTDEPAS